MMEKIQNFLNDASEFIFGDQTQDHAIVIDEQMKIDLANYIDDMGYDLVGYGFLGEVERDENNNIEEIKSADDSVDYLYAYILANERTYALQGSDDNLQNNVTNILTVLGGFAISPGIGVGILFTKVADGLSNSIYLENHKELTGMISIPLIEFQDSADDFFDTVIIDRDKNELKVSRWNPSLDEGFTNIDTWSWDLNGWSGRYGKPLELSLALHLSTMAPDFVYNFCMDEDLQTIVNVALKNIEYNATYKYVTANNETVTEGQVNEVYIDMKDYIDEMKYLESTEKRELPTPLNDNYATPKGIFEDINVVEVNNKRYRFTNKEGNTIQCFSEKGETLMENYYMSFDENGEPFFENATDDNSSRLEANEDNPCFYYDDNNIEIEIKILCLNEIINILSSESADEYLKEVALENLSEMANFSDKTVDNWIDNKIKNPSQTYKRGDEKYSNQFNNVKDSNDNYKEKAERLREIQSNLIEDFSLVLSDYEKQQEENNKLLEKWGIDTTTLEILYNVFNNVSSELKTYQPYITSVTNHWYKDIYFAGTPESGQTLKNISPGDIVYKLVDSKSDSQAYNPEGLANSEEIEILNENGQFYVDLTPKSGFTEVEQVGQPGYTDEEEWHWKVKNWIQYGYYFIYDGTEKTADEIKRARKYLKNEAENKYDSTDPLLGVDEEIELKADKINTELKEKGFNVKLQRINFAKKSSLAAFSILESVHTFDAEYVYRDLKEFLIDLGYFEREDFDLIETGVLDWIIPEYKPEEWPVTKYEKKDTEYGTFILSRASVEKIKEEQTEKSDNNKQSIDTEGFEEGLDVITPGEAIVVDIDNDKKSITLKFTAENTVKDMTMKIEGISVNPDIEKDSAIGKGELIGTTIDEDVKLLMRDNKKAIINNIEDYMKTTTKNILSVNQPYQFTEEEVEIIAKLISHEGTPEYFSSVLGDSDLGMEASKVTAYVLVNRALLNYGGHGNTILEQLTAPGQYAGADTLEEWKNIEITPGAMQVAEWVSKYDCSSVLNPKGEPMTRNVVGQSGWCQCKPDGVPGETCWWWIDTTGDGQVTQANSRGDPPYDTFYCKNSDFPEN